MQIDPAALPNNTSIIVIKLLCLLAESGRAYRNVTDLSRLTGGSNVSVSEHLYKLEQGGLVHRSPHPKDRRQSLFTLTANGKALVRTWQPESLAIV